MTDQNGSSADDTARTLVPMTEPEPVSTEPDTRPHTGGRPSKLTDERVDEFIRICRVGVPILHACAAVGITKSTAYDWMKLAKADTEAGLDGTLAQRFSDGVRSARSEFITRAVEGIHAAGVDQSLTVTTVRKVNVDGVETTETREVVRPPDAAHLAWLLERRAPSEFSKRTEITGADGGPVELVAMTLAQKLALLQGLDETFVDSSDGEIREALEG